MTAVRRLTANPNRSLAEIVWEQRAEIAALQASVAGLQAVVARQGDAIKALRLSAPKAPAAAPNGPLPRAPAATLVMLGGTVRQIVDAVAAQHGVGAREILGSDRTRYVVLARQEVMYHARLAGLSLAQIGRAMGRDHTTVMAGIEAHKRRAGLE